MARSRVPRADEPSATTDERRRFWVRYQPGFRSTDQQIGTPEFFADVERYRYTTEPAILQFARFADWAGRDVVEVGCGIGTDAVGFVRAGARYTGIDSSPIAIDLARQRFARESGPARFLLASAESVPVESDTQDLVYSNGVIHHIPDTERAVDEIHRILRPGGRAVVMVYHRGSFNYWFTIMVVRRLLVLAVVVPALRRLLARWLKEDEAVLMGHRRLLSLYGPRYVLDRRLFLSHNTDGPGNPLSKVYSAEDARWLFHRFSDVRTHVRFLNLRLYPGGQKLAASRTGVRLERRFGWHLWIEATK